ncbi:MAG TPA: hypothetical protein DCS91_09125 [Microcoleaceae bacterium UBA11344]|nr:hypothetical protein [Microcoleaceae cyanobacterium UBA11344]
MQLVYPVDENDVYYELTSLTKLNLYPLWVSCGLSPLDKEQNLLFIFLILKMPVINFIHQLKLQDIPEAIQQEGVRSLLDTLGAAIIGRKTHVSHIVNEYVVTVSGGKGAFLWLDGREVSMPAAAFANGMTTDAMGIYGGHPLARGTAGATLLATLLATIPPNATGQELLTSWIMGFEVAFRAGIALNKRDSSRAHTACTWNAIGSAAIASRLLSLSVSQTKHALGIAEYTAPVAPITRTVAYPTMLRTGAGWAAWQVLRLHYWLSKISQDHLLSI